jgi:hypothetical protein
VTKQPNEDDVPMAEVVGDEEAAVAEVVDDDLPSRPAPASMFAAPPVAPAAGGGGHDRAILARLGKAERNFKILLTLFIVFVVLSVGSVVAYLMLKKHETDQVFRVTDENGIVRVTFDAVNGLTFVDAQGATTGRIAVNEVGLTFIDAKNVKRLGFSLAGDDTSIAMVDASQANRAALSVSASGEELAMSGPATRTVALAATREGPVLRLQETGSADASLVVTTKGGAALRLAGRTPVTLASAENEASLRLADADSKSRISLAATSESSSLRLANAAGVVRATLEAAGDTPGLTVNDAQGAPRLTLAVSEGGPAVDLLTAAGKKTVVLVPGRLSMTDGADLERATLSAADATLKLIDVAGKPRAVLAAADSGLVLSDAAGKPRATLGLSDGASSVSLLDADGRRRAGLVAAAEGPSLSLLGSADSRISLAARGKEQILEYVDAAGQKRMSLLQTGGGPCFTLYGAKGAAQTDLRIDGATPIFKLLDESGGQRVVLESTSAMSGLDIYDVNHKPRARVLVGDLGPRFVFTDASGAEVKPIP